jgi:hypothetical protein
VSFWDHRYTAFTFGFLGGLAVNLFRLYLVSQSPLTERPEFDGIYWAQFAGLALMGGVAALAHDLSNQISPWVALNVGLSIPALIRTAAELQGPKRKRRTN